MYICMTLLWVIGLHVIQSRDFQSTLPDHPCGMIQAVQLIPRACDPKSFQDI